MERNWTDSQKDAIRLRNRLLVVSAAAGSGKTSVLTEHIIRMLLDKEHPAELSRLLVVTFTRSSASDLRSKISQALSDALAENPEDAHLEKQILSLGQAKISTIDSFFGDEVRAGFSALGLSPDFRIADENELNDIALPLMEDTLSELYGEYTVSNSTSPDNPFARLHGNRFADTMDHLLSNRGNGKIALKLWQFYRRFSHYPEGLELLKTYADDLHGFGNGEESFFDTKIGRSVRKRFSVFLADAKAGLDSFAEKFGTLGVYETYRQTLDTDTEALNKLSHALDGSYEDVQTALDEFKLEKFNGKESGPDAETKAIYKDNFRNDLKKQIEKFKGKFFSWSPEEIATQLAKHADECDLLYVLFTRFGEKLNAEKRSREFLSFDDMPTLLLKLLTDADGNKTPYGEELSDRYDAVFIDEYQDVDPIQDEIFRLIGGDRRFMVGDIKQSIYGFRGGEPSIFASYREKQPLYDKTSDDGQSGVCIFMSENFRCSQPVIDYTNKICSFLFSASPESVGYRPQDDLVHGKKSSEEKAVAVRTVLFETKPKKSKSGDADGEDASAEDAEKENREALWVAKEIERLLRSEKLENGDSVQPKDIAILFRKSKPMDAFANALEARGIPCIRATSANLLLSPLMTDTLNFLRAVDNPQRDLPLSEFLISQLGGFTLAELGDIRAVDADKCSLYDSMQKMSGDDTDPLGEKCADFVANLEKFRRLSSVQPADRFLKLLFSDAPFSYYAETAELRALYEEARKCVSFSWYGLYAFLNHMDRLSDSRDGLPAGGFEQTENAVRLTTVHKSKGLEYPVVFFSDCGSLFSKQATDAPLLFHKSVGVASKLFNPENSENEISVLHSAVKKAVEEDEREEDIRIVYVALTRAKERLYVTGTPPKGAKLDTYAKSAKCIGKDRRSQILGVSNRLVWFYSALGEENIEIIPYAEELSDVAETPPDIPDMSEEPLKEISQKGDSDEKEDEDFALVSYPYSALRDVPTKAPASSLTPDYLDRISQFSDDSPESIATAIGIVRDDVTDFDSLLRSHKPATATEFGTAMHAFLEACDFKNLRDCGVDAELKRLTESGILSDDTVSILGKKQLEKFRNSPLMTCILGAKEVVREQKFGINLPIASLTKHPERFANVENETIFVQGSIDLLLLMPDGSIRLYDYKTDHLGEDEFHDTEKLRADLTARHADQLACYAKAVRKLFGKQPDFIGIYSFPLGDAIAIDIDTNLFA